MAKVDELALAVAETARAEPDDGLVIVLRSQLHDVGERQGAARDRQPVDHGVLLDGQLPDAIAEELLQGRRQRAEPRVPALGAREDRDAFAALVLGLADLDRPSLEERIDHLEQEEGVPADLRQESAHTCRRRRAPQGASRPDALARRA